MKTNFAEQVEYPYWKELLLFPYRFLLSWWLDALLRRPSNTVFKRAFDKEFDWFLQKHGLRAIQNPCLYNLLGVYLNAKWLTLESRSLQLRLTYLVNEFQITVRATAPRQPWQSLAIYFPELANDQTSHLGWQGVVELLDRNWRQFEDDVLNNRGSFKGEGS